jgi:hypothetical protein
MKTNVLALLLSVVLFSSCTQPQSNSKKTDKPESPDLTSWIGRYSCSIDYGKLDETSHILIGYDLEISPDSIIFSGMGYQTYFSDLCTSQRIGDTLVLFYKQTLEGTDYNKNENPLLKLYKVDQKYIAKSPVIYVGTDANKEVQFEKE